MQNSIHHHITPDEKASEWHIQTVKNMLSKSNTQSFKEVLGDFRATNIGTGLPSPA